MKVYHVDVILEHLVGNILDEIEVTILEDYVEIILDGVDTILDHIEVILDVLEVFILEGRLIIDGIDLLELDRFDTVEREMLYARYQSNFW